jgi:uncharacterized protein involved in outer membrane biogenesis
VSGTLAEPLQMQDVTVDLDLRGPDLAKLYDLVGLPLPMTPPYALSGRLERRGNQFSYRDFTGTVGDSDLSGNATVALRGKRPQLTAVLRSKVLDFDDLGGLIGGTPGTGPGETASSEQKQAASAQRASGRLLPSRPIRLDVLRSMDADVRLTAAHVESAKLPLEGMNAHLKLVNGQLTLDPLDFGAAGGKLANIAHLDARHSPATFTLDMKIRQLELPKLLPHAKLMQDSLGSFSGDVQLEGRGDSAASVMASANGSFGAIMGEGRISNLLLEVAGLDIAESLGFLIGGDRQVTVRCAYADFEVVDGRATARSFVFDTADTVLLLRGDIDFNDESLHLKMLARPRDISLVAIRTPIRIGGTLADPSIAPEGEPLLLRGTIVAALAAVAPPLALLGLIETGPGKNTSCVSEPPDRKHRPKAPRENGTEARPGHTPGPRSAS